LRSDTDIVSITMGLHMLECGSETREVQIRYQVQGGADLEVKQLETISNKKISIVYLC